MDTLFSGQKNSALKENQIQQDECHWKGIIEAGMGQ